MNDVGGDGKVYSHVGNNFRFLGRPISDDLSADDPRSDKPATNATGRRRWFDTTSLEFQGVTRRAGHPAEFWRVAYNVL
jgi:hypothetical protein